MQTQSSLITRAFGLEVNRSRVISRAVRKVLTAVILGDIKYSQAPEAPGLSINTQHSHSLKKLRHSLDMIMMIMLR